MTEKTGTLTARAAELRRAFDQTFATAPDLAPVETADFLAIRIGDDRWAIEISEISGLYPCQSLTPLPGRSSFLLGLTGLRGAVLPVYDLHALLSYRAEAQPRWLVVAAKARLCLGFAVLDGYQRVPRKDGPAQALADLSAILEKIRQQASVIGGRGLGP